MKTSFSAERVDDPHCPLLATWHLASLSPRDHGKRDRGPCGPRSRGRDNENAPYGELLVMLCVGAAVGEKTTTSPTLRAALNWSHKAAVPTTANVCVVLNSMR